MPIIYFDQICLHLSPLQFIIYHPHTIPSELHVIFFNTLNALRAACMCMFVGQSSGAQSVLFGDTDSPSHSSQDPCYREAVQTSQCSPTLVLYYKCLVCCLSYLLPISLITFLTSFLLPLKCKKAFMFCKPISNTFIY